MSLSAGGDERTALALLGLAVAGCAAPAGTAGGAASASAAGEVDLSPADVARLADAALFRYDEALLARLLLAEAAHLESEARLLRATPGASPVAADRARLVRFGRLAHRLADMRKFEATAALDDAGRARAVAARLAVVERALPLLEEALARHADDPELHFLVGELLAFRIDGVVSGMAHGPRSRRLLERAVALGAGAGAELALARRFYYLPTFAGGDPARAAAEMAAVVERHPGDEPAWASFGEVLVFEGDAAGARAALLRAAALDPHSPRARLLLAEPTRELRP